MIKEGIEVKRETDAGVLLEKRQWLEIIKRSIPDHESIFYPTADEEIVHITKEGIDICFLSAKGSSFTANMAERLRVSGANPLLRIGTCGALDKQLELWEPVITTACYKDEGTSRHYIDSNFPAMADPDFTQLLRKYLKQHGIDANIGLSVTTDGRWVEDFMFMQDLANKGIKTIEMETSALFTVAQVRRLIAGAINIPTDYPLEHTKNNFKGTTDHNTFKERIEETIEKLLPAIIEILLETRKRIINSQ